MRCASIGLGTVGGPQFVFLEFWEVRRQIGTELPLSRGKKWEHCAPKGKRRREGSVGLNDAVIEAVVVSDGGIVEGFEGGLKFKWDTYESFSGVDQVPGLTRFGAIASNLGLGDGYRTGDFIQAVLQVLLLDGSSGTFPARVVGSIEDKHSEVEGDQESNESPFIEDVSDLLDVSFVPELAVDMGWIAHGLLLLSVLSWIVTGWGQGVVKRHSGVPCGSPPAGLH